MELLWDCCDNNALPSEIPDFDKHLDPLDGKKLAADDIERQILAKGKKEKIIDIVNAVKEKFNKDYDVVNQGSATSLTSTQEDEPNERKDEEKKAS